MSQAEASEKSSLKMMEPSPGLISGVEVRVGIVFNVGVADGGNQTMVAVGGGVSEGMGVSVGGGDSKGAQEAGIIVTARRAIIPMTPVRIGRRSLDRVGDFVLAGG